MNEHGKQSLQDVGSQAEPGTQVSSYGTLFPRRAREKQKNGDFGTKQTG